MPPSSHSQDSHSQALYSPSPYYASFSPALQQSLAEVTPHPLHNFAVIFEQKVEWGDMDAFNHVNNVVYYDYAQRARIYHLEQIDMFNDAAFTVLASSSCQYLLPVTYPDTLWIGVRAKKIGTTSLTHEYIYYSAMQQAVVATAESVLVFFDKTGTAKQPFSEEQKVALMAT